MNCRERSLLHTINTGDVAFKLRRENLQTNDVKFRLKSRWVITGMISLIDQDFFNSGNVSVSFSLPTHSNYF